MSELIKEGATYPNGSGSLTVLKYEKAIRILVKHNDEYGHEMWTQADRIRKGVVRNPFEKHKNGVIYLHLENGSIEIDVESYFGQIDYINYCFVSNIINDKFYYHYLGDGSIEAVNEYLIENNIKAKYMEEVSEAASQTF